MQAADTVSTQVTNTPKPGSSGGMPDSLFGQMGNITKEAEESTKATQAATSRIMGEMEAQRKAVSSLPTPAPLNLGPRPRYGNVDIIQGMANPMAIMAIFGSLLTRRPLVAALNAASAAMQGYAQGNREAYDRAEQEWRDNMEIALKQHEDEWQQWRAKIEESGNNMQMLQAELTAVASQNHDVLALENLKAGNLGMLLQYKESMARSAEAARNHLDMADLRRTQQDELQRYHDALIGEREATRKDREAAAASKRTDRQAVINSVDKSIGDAISMLDNDPTVAAGAGYLRSFAEHGQAALSDWGLTSPPSTSAADFQSKIDSIEAVAGKLLTNRSTGAIDARMTDILSGNKFYGGSAVVKQQLFQLRSLLQDMSTAPLPSGSGDYPDPSSLSDQQLMKILQLPYGGSATAP